MRYNQFNILINKIITDEYLTLLYEYYIHTQPGIFGTYYSIDKENSIYDEKIKSDYGTTGSGLLSGVKYKAFYYTPMVFSEYNQRSDTFDQQHGYNSQMNVKFNISIPAFSEFTPAPNDVIKFDAVKEETKLFRVMNIERANISEIDTKHNLFRLYVEPYYVDYDSIENIVTERYAFLQNKLKFVTLDLFNEVMDIFEQLEIIYKYILNSYKAKYDCYVETSKNNFKLDWLNQIFNDFYKDILSTDFNFIKFLTLYKNTKTFNTIDDLLNFIKNIDYYYNEDNDFVKNISNDKYLKLKDIYSIDISNTQLLDIKNALENNNAYFTNNYNFVLESLLNIVVLLEYYKSLDI